LAKAFGGRFSWLLSRREVLAALAGSLCAGGCGLSDYEAQMAIEQQQVQRFDEEEKYLGAPLQMPKLMSGTKEVDTPDIFFRPPKGIAPEPDSNPGPPPYSRYLARTTGRNSERVGIVELYLALGSESQKDFVTVAVQAFPQLSGATARELAKQRPEGESVLFNLYENRETDFSLYIYQGNGIRLAIGYQSDRTAKDSTRAIDLSIGSLVVGPYAAKLRKRYEDRVRRHR
jgi:hypothetical protein